MLLLTRQGRNLTFVYPQSSEVNSSVMLVSLAGTLECIRVCTRQSQPRYQTLLLMYSLHPAIVPVVAATVIVMFVAFTKPPLLTSKLTSNGAEVLVASSVAAPLGDPNEIIGIAACETETISSRGWFHMQLLSWPYAQTSSCSQTASTSIIPFPVPVPERST